MDISVENPRLEEAFTHMVALHGDQRDKSGVMYFYHPLRVMLRLGPNAPHVERCAAMLHDVIEDTETNFQDLEDLGYQDDVLDMVNLLTRRDDESHSEYLTRIIASGNVGAMRVKLADLYDNADLTRANDCPFEEIRHLILNMIEDRYVPAIKRMKAAILNATGKEVDDILDGELEIDLRNVSGEDDEDEG